MTRVIVTEPEYQKAIATFRNAGIFECIPAPEDEAGLAAKIRETGAQFVIVGTTRYIRELYGVIPTGGIIARFGVGHDGVDKALAKANGILCCNTPGVLDDSVAECTIGLMLASARHLLECSSNTKTGTWTPQIGTELSGKTLAIIGYGNIGCKVGRIAKSGLGMKVVGFGNRDPVDMSFPDLFTTDFSAAVQGADIVSLHIPDVPANRNFIGADRLKMMKSSSVLINTARGGVVDEDALYDAVQSGLIAGAALDVFKNEPYFPLRPDKDLRTLRGIIMTPHLGSSTQEACERMARAALRNIELALQGRHGEITFC